MVHNDLFDLTPEAAAAKTPTDLGRLLRRLLRREARQRGDSPWTYRELAAKTGWSLGSISRYLDGKVVPPTDRFDDLVRLLGATPAEQGALATARDRVAENRRTATADTPGPARSVPRQLPANITGFAGRDIELAKLDALRSSAADPAAMVVAVVTGTAGVGKTSLAVHWAHRAARDFRDGQLYVNLRGFDPARQAMSPAEAIRRLLDALGVAAERIPADLDAQAALYRSRLAGRQVLILLDNARDTAQVRPLLPGSATCLVLVTSRNQLTGLVATDGAHPIRLDVLTAQGARELLVRRLGPEVVMADTEAVEGIIVRCAGLPLALAIVAARAASASLPLAALAEALRHANARLGVLTTDDPAADVRAVISWSYRALPADAARLFRMLGRHRGPDISAAAAASLAGLPRSRVRELLADLVQANLLVQPVADRYSFHDLLRAYAGDLADHTESEVERQAVVDRILDHYLHTAVIAARQLHGHRDLITVGSPRPGVSPESPSGHRAALDWFMAEHEVLLAAVDQASGAARDVHTWKLASALAGFLNLIGRWHDQVTTQRAAIAAATRLGDPVAQAQTHRLAADALIQLHRRDDARDHLRHSLKWATEAGDILQQAHTYHSLAMLLERQRPAEARDQIRLALDRYRAAGNRPGQARALNALGWLHAVLGDHQDALACCQEALTMHQETGNRQGQAATWDSLGYAYQQLDRHVQALRCYERALDLNRELGDRFYEAASLSRIGEVHHDGGDPAAARDVWQQALVIYDDLDHPNAGRIRARLGADSRR